MTTLTQGDRVPTFEVEDETGRTWTPEDLEGEPFVLFFYPRDDTPGCTKEACSFRDAMDDFDEVNVPVFGVSDDDAKTHRSFKEKHDLNFPLLVDEGGELADAFGVWVKKNMFGNEFYGNQRATFLIDAEGTIQKAWPNVNPENHAQQVLGALQKA